MKNVKSVIIFSILICATILWGCQKKEESILPSANDVQETTNKTESKKVSEDIEIDKEYLEKKYPGKTVLTWVYTEIENMSKKERKKYNEPLGMKYITNNQVIKLNDYLVSKGKEYVICFKKIGEGKNYAEAIEKLTKKGEAPDFIFSECYLEEKKKNYTSYLTYELIGKDMLEELSQYKNSDLKNYFSTLPENAIKLSSVNGKFYGYNEAIGELESKHKWYVNVDLAKEYGIDLDKYKTGGYEEWLEACNKVYAGEKKKGSINFVVCYGGALKPIYESSVAGYMDKLDEKGNTDVSAFSISLNGKSIENYFKLKDVKKSLKEVREYQNRGYFEYLNEDETNNTLNANIFICNLFYDDVNGHKEEIDRDAFPKVKEVKLYKWGNNSVKPQDLIEFNAVNGIYKKSNNKKIALKAYDFINSDVEASNIIKFPEYDGTGKEYSITSDEYYEYFSREENEGKFDTRGCMFVNPLVANPFKDRNSTEEMKKNIENLKFNEKYVDKFYDFTPVKKEIEKIMSLEKEYLGDSFNYEGSDNKGKIFTGDFETEYNNFLKALDKAGIEKVLSYLNKQ